MDATPGHSSCDGASQSTGKTAEPSSNAQQPQQHKQNPTDIPEGLYDLLKGVTVAVLRDRPADLYSFVADYFTKVYTRRIEKYKVYKAE